MNGQVAKKLRKLAREHYTKGWIEYYKAMREWPLMARLRFAWNLIFG